MPDFTYDEINAEKKLLGLPYPKNEDFTEEEIEAALADLGECYTTETVATLNSSVNSPSAVAAFARLAALIPKASVSSQYGLKATRPVTDAQKRENALNQLRYAKDAKNSAVAKESLRSKATAESRNVLRQQLGDTVIEQSRRGEVPGPCGPARAEFRAKHGVSQTGQPLARPGHQLALSRQHG